MASDRSALAILRRTQVEQETGLAKSTLYVRVEQGLFTEPVLIGPRAVGWPAGEVEALNRARIAGSDTESIKRLVKSLHAERRVQATLKASLEARGLHQQARG